VKFVSELKRKRGESFEGFIRRVKRQWQRSGKILQAKKVKFYSPKKSKNVQRKQTVGRTKKISKMNYLRKIGKLPPEEDKFRRRK
jgi:ribosomal protein S21